MSDFQSPTPWQIEGRGVLIRDANGRHVAEAALYETPRDAEHAEYIDEVDCANADFIVTAVNAYDKQRALIETMVKALTAAQFSSEELCQDQFEGNECWVTLNTIRAAIAAAKQEGF